MAPTSPTSGSGGGSGGGSELPDTGASAELFTAGMIGALFVGVGAILLLAGRRRGPTPTHLAGD